jgi:hypothetical protein
MSENKKTFGVVSVDRPCWFQYVCLSLRYPRVRRGIDCMVVGFTTTYAISDYPHWCCEFKSQIS